MGRITFCAFVLFFGLSTQRAEAYIDPGSGSAIMSAIIGLFVAFGLLLKTYWYKIKSLFGGGKVESKSEKIQKD